MKSNNPDDIVGHKTKWDADKREFHHEPLTRAEADAVMESVIKAEVRRAELMPDEHSAIQMMFDTVLRLKEFGWRDAAYCPKDGREFIVLEAGSTGQHRCRYEGKWPDGTYWILEDGDMCPSRPVLFKELP